MKTLVLSFTIMILGFAPVGAAQQMQIPEVGAFLPSITKVKPKDVMAIDGLWSVSSIDKIVRIDRGRIYAVEGWNHLFVLKIKPGMVVIHPFIETAPGMYEGDDLPLQGQFVARLTGDRILNFDVDGALGKASYQLVPQQLDDPEAFNALIKIVRSEPR
jgi:hypothetical protein